MDHDIAQVANSFRQRVGCSSTVSSVPLHDSCRDAGDNFCRRYGLFADDRMCTGCKSNDSTIRRRTLHKLVSVSSHGCDERPCDHRSDPIHVRAWLEECRKVPVSICSRDAAPVTSANCDLCASGNEKDRPGDLLAKQCRVLNAKLVPAVPTISTATPDVRVFDLHGIPVAFDANSLCAVQVDECIANELRHNSSDAFRGLLFSRQKPQFRLSRAALIRRIVLNVTHACNLACSYCFAGGNRTESSMTLATARKALALLDPRGKVDVAFFGGEPLLAWDLIREVVSEAQALANKRKVQTKFHITTNALALDAKKLRFLCEQSCSLLVSLDGPENIHNTSRPARDPKRNSFRETLAALERAKGLPISRRIMARATFDAAKPQLVQRLQFLAKLDDEGLINGFSVEPAVLGEGCARRTATYDRDALAAEYHNAARWYVERIRRGRSANFFHFRRLLQRILYAAHAGTECGGGNGYVTVGTDGTLYACHREGGTGIGHVAYGIDEEARSAWADNRIYARNGCMRCWARYLCGGGCRQACLELAGDLHAAVAERCFIQKTLLRECLWILTQLTREEITPVVKP